MSAQIIERIGKNLHLVTVYPTVDITPEIASQLLELNDSNRPLKNSTVTSYVEAMKRGEWKFNGDTIRISKTGRLLDGQHRLTAVIKSGKTIQQNIQTGLDDETFDIMDIGKNRGGADILAIGGVSYGQTIAPAIKIISMYYALKTKRIMDISTRRNPLTNHQITEWMKKHEAKDSLENYASIAQRLFRYNKVISQSTYVAFLYILGQKHRDDAMFFFELFASGENISATSLSPIYLLRQKFMNQAASKVRVADQREKWALIIKAWNFFREKKEIKQLTYNPDKEPFPQAI